VGTISFHEVTILQLCSKLCLPDTLSHHEEGWTSKRVWLERKCLIASDCTVGVFVVHAQQWSTGCSQSRFTYSEATAQKTASYLTVFYLKSWYLFNWLKIFLHFLKRKVHPLILESLALNPNQAVVSSKKLHNVKIYNCITFPPTPTYARRHLITRFTDYNLIFVSLTNSKGFILFVLHLWNRYCFHKAPPLKCIWNSIYAVKNFDTTDIYLKSILILFCCLCLVLRSGFAF
jgi:hypothetical protein